MAQARFCQECRSTFHSNTAVVITRRGHPFAVGAEDNAHHGARIACQRLPQQLAVLGIPQPHSLVITSRGKPFAVRTEGDACHGVHIACQRLPQRLAVLGIPQVCPHCPCAQSAPRGEPFAVGTEGNARHEISYGLPAAAPTAVRSRHPTAARSCLHSPRRAVCRQD